MYKWRLKYPLKAYDIPTPVLGIHTPFLIKLSLSCTKSCMCISYISRMRKQRLRIGEYIVKSPSGTRIKTQVFRL